MSALTLPDEVFSISSSSDAEKLIPFPRELELVFYRLECIRKDGRLGASHPSDETIDWAGSVLLRVVPSTYLIGADINPFESEIHVTWESDSKSVIVFFTAPEKIKIYYEWLENTERKHNLVTTDDVREVSSRLRWFFQ